MIRKIIEIDKEKCNGCGLCAHACHEGAIGMVDGKATLLRDDYCDGLGNCLPVCPTGAISFVEREAAAYDEAAVQANMQAKSQPHTGCLGSMARSMERAPVNQPASFIPMPSQLRQWPVQIKLVPVNDVGSQVIVNGEVLGNMSARDYFKYKKKLVPDIMKAYNVLAAENDIIVIEGAGSPAEINLKSDDIVNMGMAKMAKAPVLLVGDIDRGGVFAQLIGTVMLLEEDEKEMVKGLIINKFRGDKTILDPGVEMLEERSGIPVVGVAPYLNIQVEDEDSLTERFETNRTVDLIDIAVIRVPRISNFTDFNPLESIQGILIK